MPLVPFDQLPDNARLWVFAASRPLTSAESQTLMRHIDAYLGTWAAHGSPLRNGRAWHDDRFLMVAVDESSAGASGCSIDGLMRTVRDAEEHLGVKMTDNAPVWYRDNREVRQVDRAQFRDMAKAGSVSPDTIVFDNTITTLGAVREGRWETAARETWHGRAFFGEQATSRR